MLYIGNLIVLVTLYSVLVSLPNHVSCNPNILQSDAVDGATTPRRTDSVLQVGIYNEANFHGEVWPAFAHAFIQKGHSVNVYAMDRAYHMAEMVSSWIPHDRIMPPRNFQDRLCYYDVIVFITMQHTSKNNAITPAQEKSKRFNPDQILDIMQQQCSTAYFEKIKVFGVVHDPRELDKRVVANTRVPNFITLSAHVTQALQDGMQARVATHGTNARNPRVYTLPPIFPLDHSVLTTPEFTTASREAYRGIVVQGIVSRKRRDYSAVVQEALRHPQQPKRFNLTILGSNARNAAVELQIEHPQFLTMVNLQQLKYYADFYGMIKRHLAIYPAFAKDGKTLSVKASSTVPCSLISNTPLIASEALLKAYTYLDREAVWMEASPTKPFDELQTIGVAELEEKFGAMERNRQKIYTSNIAVVDDMLSSAVPGVIPMSIKYR